MLKHYLPFILMICSWNSYTQESLQPLLCKEFDNYYTYDEVYLDAEDNFYLGFRNFYTSFFQVTKDLKRGKSFTTRKVGFDDFENPVIYESGNIIDDGLLHYQQTGDKEKDKQLKKFSKALAKLSAADRLDAYHISSGRKYLACEVSWKGGGAVRVYSRESNYSEYFSFKYKSYLKYLDISPDEQFMAFQVNNGDLYFINLSTQNVIAVGKADDITGFMLNSKNQLVVSTYYSTTVYDATTAKALHTIKHVKKGNRAVSGILGQSLVVYSYFHNTKNRNQEINIYDLQTGALREGINFPGGYRVEVGRISSEGYLYTFSYKKICIWDIQEKQGPEDEAFVVKTESQVPKTKEGLFAFYDNMNDKEKNKFRLLVDDVLCKDYEGVNASILDDLLADKPDNYVLKHLNYQKMRIQNEHNNNTSYAGYNRENARIKNYHLGYKEQFNVVNGILQPYLAFRYDLKNEDDRMKFLITNSINATHLWDLKRWLDDSDGNSKRSSPLYTVEKYHEFRAIVEQLSEDAKRLSQCGCQPGREENQQSLIEKSVAGVGGVRYRQFRISTDEVNKVVKELSLDQFYIHTKTDEEILATLNQLFNSEAFKKHVMLIREFGQKVSIRTYGNFSKTVLIEDDHTFLSYQKPRDETMKDFGYRVRYGKLNLYCPVYHCEKTTTSEKQQEEFQDLWLTKKVTYFNHELSCSVQSKRLEVFRQLLESRLLGKAVNDVPPSDKQEEQVVVKIRENVDLDIIDSWFNVEETYDNSDLEILEGEKYIYVSKDKDEEFLYISIHDGGILSPDVCEDDYRVTYKEKYREAKSLTDPNKDSSTDADYFSAESLPITVTINYRDHCYTDEYKRATVVIKKMGVYSINLD